jgi:predicted nucleotidyltransferase
VPLPETARRQAERLELLQSEARRIAAELASDPAVRKVILFGSAARGQACTTSDLDLIVVMRTDLPFIERYGPVWRRTKPVIAVDLLVYTPQEFEQLVQNRPFIRSAVHEGKVLYDADANPAA